MSSFASQSAAHMEICEDGMLSYQSFAAEYWIFTEKKFHTETPVAGIIKRPKIEVLKPAAALKVLLSKLSNDILDQDPDTMGPTLIHVSLR